MGEEVAGILRSKIDWLEEVVEGEEEGHHLVLEAVVVAVEEEFL